MKLSGISLVLLLLSSTLLFCQKSNSSDTIRCYTRTQLVKIATKFAKGDLCDSILTITNQQLINKDTIIKNQNFMIKDYKQISVNKDLIITGKESDIKNLNLQLNKEKRANKLLKICGVSITGVLLTLLTFSLIHS